MDRTDRSELLFFELAQAGLLDISCKGPMMASYDAHVCLVVIQKLCNVFEWYPTSKHFGCLRAKSHTFLARWWLRRLKFPPSSPGTRMSGNKTKKNHVHKLKNDKNALNI